MSTTSSLSFEIGTLIGSLGLLLTIAILVILLHYSVPCCNRYIKQKSRPDPHCQSYRRFGTNTTRRYQRPRNQQLQILQHLIILRSHQERTTRTLSDLLTTVHNLQNCLVTPLQRLQPQTSPAANNTPTEPTTPVLTSRQRHSRARRLRRRGLLRGLQNQEQSTVRDLGNSLRTTPHQSRRDRDPLAPSSNPSCPAPPTYQNIAPSGPSGTTQTTQKAQIYPAARTGLPPPITTADLLRLGSVNIQSKPRH